MPVCCCNHRSAADSDCAVYDDTFALSAELAQTTDEGGCVCDIGWGLAVRESSPSSPATELYKDIRGRGIHSKRRELAT